MSFQKLVQRKNLFLFLSLIFILPQALLASRMPKWIEFVSSQYNFSVLLPSQPQIIQEPARLTQFHGLATKGITYESRHPKYPEAYRIAIIHLKPESDTRDPEDFLIDAATSLTESHYRDDDPKVFVSGPKKFQGHPLVDYGIKVDQQKGILGRLILVNNLVYNIEFIYRYPFNMRSWESFWRTFDLATPETRDDKERKQREDVIQSFRMWNGLQ